MEHKLSSKGLAFLADTDWKTAEITPLTQDASARRYFRLRGKDQKTAVLMDSSQAATGELGRFLSVGAYLIDLDLSAPQILTSNGEFTVLEDFGDARFADLPDDPLILYRLAIDALVHLQARAPMHGLPVCDFAHLGELTATAWQWYPQSAVGALSPAAQEASDFAVAAAKSLALKPTCTMLRDFHAENLMWLPKRDGIRQVGLLDFQDAMIGHPVFDVVSLLQDARRDIAPDFERQLGVYFQEQAGMSPEHFQASYAALGAFRNLRIIGMFARLGKLLGRPGYIELIPRVWRYLDSDLAHPALKDLRGFVQCTLSPPTEPYLKKLKSLCPKPPIQ